MRWMVGLRSADHSTVYHRSRSSVIAKGTGNEAETFTVQMLTVNFSNVRGGRASVVGAMPKCRERDRRVIAQAQVLSPL